MSVQSCILEYSFSSSAGWPQVFVWHYDLFLQNFYSWKLIKKLIGATKIQTADHSVTKLMCRPPDHGDPSGPPPLFQRIKKNQSSSIHLGSLLDEDIKPDTFNLRLRNKSYPLSNLFLFYIIVLYTRLDAEMTNKKFNQISKFHWNFIWH